MRVMNECVNYLKKNKGFTRLMEGIYDLYVRYERCFGAVRLARPTPEEEKAISELFRRDYYDQALIRIGLADFERQIHKNFSEDIRMANLLEAYFGKQITLRTSPRTVNAFTIFVESELLPRYMGTEAEEWLREITAHVRRVYRSWADRYTTEPQVIARMMVAICEVLLVLPGTQGKTERLQSFAEKHTGNAHLLDMGGEYGALLLRALACRYDTLCPSSPEECSALYFRAGLLTEGVLNCVTVRGLCDALSGGEPEEAIHSYTRRNEAHMLTLENLNHITAVGAYKSRVFIMENLPVFSAVSEQLRELPCTLICADGGFNGAFMYLIDRLCETGVMLYYSGDMDYAGLCQADRLYLRHPKMFIPWRYGKEDYERIVSTTDFYVPEHKKETGLYNEDLAALLSHMRKRGKTAPQAALVNELVSDIRNIVG